MVYLAALRDKDPALKDMPYENMPSEYARVRVTIEHNMHGGRDRCVLLMP